MKKDLDEIWDLIVKTGFYEERGRGEFISGAKGLDVPKVITVDATTCVGDASYDFGFSRHVTTFLKAAQENGRLIRVTDFEFPDYRGAIDEIKLNGWQTFSLKELLAECEAAHRANKKVGEFAIINKDSDLFTDGQTITSAHLRHATI